MNIQDFLGLPLEAGQTFLEQQGIDVKILETFSKNKHNNSSNNYLKDPYILRIREIDTLCIELLISYF